MEVTTVDGVLDRSVAIERSQIALIIPTCNAARYWARLSAALRLQNLLPQQVLIVDSSSEDDTRALAAAEGYEVICIERSAFNHGGTRQMALQYVPWAEFVVYMTQDAIPETPDAIDQLLTAFQDPEIGAAYGRQLPRPGADPIEAHARLFNYPAKSRVRTFESRHTLGIKATFFSNSFGAYRVKALNGVGGFPSDIIMSEDALIAAKLLLAGWKTAYVAEAKVYHSHNFSIAEEFRRYFDIGVFHRRESWMRERFGQPVGEGKRFVLSEAKFLLPRNAHLIPVAAVRTASKALGFYLGLREAKLGDDLARRLSFHKRFWDKPAPHN